MGEHPLNIGIKMEQDSVRFYTEAASKVKNDLGRKMIESFVEDEKGHLEKLRAAKEHGSFPEARWSEATAIVTRSKNAFQSVPEDVRKTLESNPGDIEAVSAALRMEEEGDKYYRKAAESSKERAEKDLFSWLAEEERQHAFVLGNMAEYLERPGDWFMRDEQWTFDGG